MSSHLGVWLPGMILVNCFIILGIFPINIGKWRQSMFHTEASIINSCESYKSCEVLSVRLFISKYSLVRYHKKSSQSKKMHFTGKKMSLKLGRTNRCLIGNFLESFLKFWFCVSFSFVNIYLYEILLYSPPSLRSGQYSWVSSWQRWTKPK